MSVITTTIEECEKSEPRSIGTDEQSAAAKVWLDEESRIEDQVNELLDPEIQFAYGEHKKLVGEKRSMLEKLMSAKDRVRAGLANWIAAGHTTEGLYIKTRYKIRILDADAVPDEYAVRAIDEKKMEAWVSMTEGKESIPGIEISVVHVLYRKVEK